MKNCTKEELSYAYIFIYNAGYIYPTGILYLYILLLDYIYIFIYIYSVSIYKTSGLNITWFISEMIIPDTTPSSNPVFMFLKL